MRTTVNIPDALLEQARARSAAEHRTLGDILADGLRVVLFRPARQNPARPRKAALPTFKGAGVQPGVDLDSNAALLDRMETE